MNPLQWGIMPSGVDIYILWNFVLVTQRHFLCFICEGIVQFLLPNCNSTSYPLPSGKLHTNKPSEPPLLSPTMV